jgi:hypothetical protein
MERLARVEHEVKTNGGSSMRDAVMRTESKVEDLREEQKAVRAALASTQAAAIEEQTQMWSAIEAIAHSTPPNPSEGS